MSTYSQHVVFSDFMKTITCHPCALHRNIEDVSFVGDVINITVKDVSDAVYIASPLVRAVKQYSVARIDTEPLFEKIRKSFRVEKRALIPNKIDIEFPCLYAFQEWLFTQPLLIILVDSKPVVELDMVKMRPFIPNAQ